ncbi:hypothetical protein A0H81_04768 [Grifola frondosa]|uniref:Uncharacterized protein n=1 Tax=Grifola frondosa TaxID=5627 RepID=A0A1C7MGA0_GRIFR|nr:hypothetical protein A0H81_04768 [Grifola frondosa]
MGRRQTVPIIAEPPREYRNEQGWIRLGINTQRTTDIPEELTPPGPSPLSRSPTSTLLRLAVQREASAAPSWTRCSRTSNGPTPMKWHSEKRWTATACEPSQTHTERRLPTSANALEMPSSWPRTSRRRGLVRRAHGPVRRRRPVASCLPDAKAYAISASAHVRNAGVHGARIRGTPRSSGLRAECGGCMVVISGCRAMVCACSEQRMPAFLVLVLIDT